MKVTINNLELATNISKACWKNDDMYCIMEIRQRFKDNDNVIDETNNGIFFPCFHFCFYICSIKNFLM
jgi:hypothetical protein